MTFNFSPDIWEGFQGVLCNLHCLFSGLNLYTLCCFYPLFTIFIKKTNINFITISSTPILNVGLMLNHRLRRWPKINQHWKTSRLKRKWSNTLLYHFREGENIREKKQQNGLISFASCAGFAWEIQDNKRRIPRCSPRRWTNVGSMLGHLPRQRACVLRLVVGRHGVVDPTIALQNVLINIYNTKIFSIGKLINNI